MARAQDEILQRIGEKLRRIRISRGLNTNVALEIRARYQVKIDPSYLSRMERGKVEIPLRTLFALSQFYDINPGQLLDPDWMSSPQRGMEELLNDNEIIEHLDLLRDRIGERKTRQHLKLFLEQINTLLEEQGFGGSRLKAARPEGGSGPGSAR